MILYLFHDLIEASETGSTVISLFGNLWDGDAAVGGLPAASLALLGVGV